MPTQDYWGNFQVAGKQLTPIEILKEQANALNERIGQYLRASVYTNALSDATRKFRSTLVVTVPSLDRYNLDIVTIIYPLGEYYPLVLSYDLADGEEQRVESSCRNEQEFRIRLRQTLSSEQTTDTLSSLLSLVI